MSKSAGKKNPKISRWQLKMSRESSIALKQLYYKYNLQNQYLNTIKDLFATPYTAQPLAAFLSLSKCCQEHYENSKKIT